MFERSAGKIDSRNREAISPINPLTAEQSDCQIVDFTEMCRLNVDGYVVLLDIVENFWDYCPIKMRVAFKARAQRILNKKCKKIALTGDQII